MVTDMRGMNILKIGVLIFCIISFLEPEASPGTGKEPSTVVFHEDRLFITTRDTPLKELLSDIHRTYDLQVAGLEKAENFKVSLTIQGSVQDVLKRLMRHLKIKNYAFIFSDGRLRQVSIFPESHATYQYKAHENRSPPANQVTVNAVEIADIVQESQADLLDLRKGDIVAEYDGAKIAHHGQLIKVTKEKPEEEQADLVIIRNGERMQFTLNGGFIGIKIKTVKIFKSELE